MLKKTGVQSNDKPQILEIGYDTVYRHSNIQETTDTEGRALFIYDEEQYPLIEYLRDIVPQLELAIAELTTLIAGGGANV